MRQSFFLAILLLFLAGCVSPASPDSTEPLPSAGPSRACWGSGTCVSLEVAATPDARAQGLMFRAELAEDSGMLFVFEESSTHAFWMKNTLIPLDLVWMDAQGMVLDVQTAVPCESDPCPLYVSAGHSSFVLEIPAGVAAKTNLEKGVRVRLENVPSRD